MKSIAACALVQCVCVCDIHSSSAIDWLPLPWGHTRRRRRRRRPRCRGFSCTSIRTKCLWSMDMSHMQVMAIVSIQWIQLNEMSKLFFFLPLCILFSLLLGNRLGPCILSQFLSLSLSLPAIVQKCSSQWIVASAQTTVWEGERERREKNAFTGKVASFHCLEGINFAWSFIEGFKLHIN